MFLSTFTPRWLPAYGCAVWGLTFLRSLLALVEASWMACLYVSASVFTEPTAGGHWSCLSLGHILASTVSFCLQSQAPCLWESHQSLLLFTSLPPNQDPGELLECLHIMHQPWKATNSVSGHLSRLLPVLSRTPAPGSALWRASFWLHSSPARSPWI